MFHRNQKYIRSLASVAVLLAGSAAPLMARAGEDAQAGAQSAIRLVEAAGAAEQHVGGRAVRAEFERDARGGRYDVEVVRGSTVFDVRVDAQTGAVLSSSEDKADQEDAEGGADHED